MLVRLRIPYLHISGVSWCQASSKQQVHGRFEGCPLNTGCIYICIYIYMYIHFKKYIYIYTYIFIYTVHRLGWCHTMTPVEWRQKSAKSTSAASFLEILTSAPREDLSPQMPNFWPTRKMYTLPFKVITHQITKYTLPLFWANSFCLFSWWFFYGFDPMGLKSTWKSSPFGRNIYCFSTTDLSRGHPKFKFRNYQGAQESTVKSRIP